MAISSQQASYFVVVVLFLKNGAFILSSWAIFITELAARELWWSRVLNACQHSFLADTSSGVARKGTEEGLFRENANLYQRKHSWNVVLEFR